VQQHNDRPLDVWSDDELLDRHRELNGEGDIETEAGDFGQLEQLQEEMRRRGLQVEHRSTSLNEPDSQTGLGETAIDPSSGAVPPA
jgi:hypothetical protein